MTTVLDRLCKAEELRDALDTALRAAKSMREPEWTSVLDDLRREADAECERLDAVYSAEMDREEAYARRIAL